MRARGPVAAAAAVGSSPTTPATRPLRPSRAVPAVAAWAFALGAAGLARAEEVPAPAPAAVPAPAPDAGRVEAAKKHFEEGEVLREEGKWADAARAFARAVDLDPSRFAAHVRLQEVSARANESVAARYEKLAAERPDDAAAALHRLRLQPAAARVAALEKSPGVVAQEPDALRELGRAYLGVKEGAKAKKVLELAHGLRPSDRELLVLSAEAMRLAGDVPGATARLEQALRDDPEAWDVHLALARLHLLGGKPKEAGDRAEGVLALRPTHLAAMIVKAEAISRQGRHADALKVLDAALAVNPNDVDVRVAWADLTAKAGTDEAYKKAIDAYQKVIAADPRHGHARFGLAWVYERQGNLAESEKAYREALLAMPSDVGAVNSLGLVLLRQKRYQDAVVQFKKAIDINPQGPEAYLNLGATFDEQGQWSEAIAWYGKALKIKGQDTNVRALLNTAFDYEALGTYGKAEEFLLRVKKIRPDDPDVSTFLGDNLTFQKKWKAAVKHYLEATRLDPKNRFAWRGLGGALAQDGKHEDAVEALEKARALKADDPNVLLLLGSLYYQELEDLQKALDAYQAYVKAGGTDTTVPGFIEQIKSELESRK